MHRCTGRGLSRLDLANHSRGMDLRHDKGMTIARISTLASLRVSKHEELDARKQDSSWDVQQLSSAYSCIKQSDPFLPETYIFHQSSLQIPSESMKILYKSPPSIRQGRIQPKRSFQLESKVLPQPWSHTNSKWKARSEVEVKRYLDIAVKNLSPTPSQHYLSSKSFRVCGVKRM